MTRTCTEFFVTKGAAVATLALALALAGCDGGDGDPAPVDGGPPTEGDAGPRAMDDAGPPASDDAGPTVEPDGGPAPDDGGASCPPRYAGEDCTECAEGYLDWGDGECRPGCDVTGPDALDCGIGAECFLSPADGERYCLCLDGYTGDDCDECAEGWQRVGSTCQLVPPPALGLVLWLDADEPGTLDLDAEMGVREWRDRRGLAGAVAESVTAVGRPAYLPDGRDGRGAVEFDGVDDLLAVHGFSDLGSADFEVVVAADPQGSAPTGLFGALTGTSGWAFMVERHTENDFRAIYRSTPGSSGGQTAVVERTNPPLPLYVFATHQTSGSLDTLALFASDGADQASGLLNVNPSSPLDSPINLRIGRTQSARMEGPIYEVLVYSRRLSVSDREAVALYLREKWHLR
ncbi:MAG TPA: calcium-binding EGF-like domain-containing protein [Sandaracinaceae bacterium LLY-WYZ-13_1]|nr:calcium-binding EGF-like domain-containing protein [Sandaracinaceae bacterium LLY-WYZ-13_1]